MTKEKVRWVVMDMGSYRAPCLDRFQPFVFKRYLEVVGDNVWVLVHQAFEIGMVDSSLVEALIVLIPKMN